MTYRSVAVAAALAAVLCTDSAVAVSESNPFEPAAIVDDQIVTRYDVSQRARQIALARGGQEADYRDAALEALIGETLLRSAAIEAGFSVSTEAVDRRLAETARAQGTTAETLVDYFVSQGIDALTVGRQLEYQLLQEAYVLWLFRDRALAAVQPADVERELVRYERRQALDFRLMQLSFGRLDEQGLADVRQLRGQIAQALEQGRNFAEIGTQLAETYEIIAFQDLGWRSERELADPALVDLLSSLSPETVSPTVELGNGTVSLFYKVGQRIRTPPGVDPFEFDIAILAAELSPDATDAQLEASVELLNEAGTEAQPCDESAGLPAGISRRMERGLTLANMTSQNRSVALELEVGQISRTSLSDRRSGGGGAVLWRFAVCERTGGIQSDSARAAAEEVVRQDLVSVQLALLGSEQVRELRRRAEIEIR